MLFRVCARAPRPGTRLVEVTFWTGAGDREREIVADSTSAGRFGSRACDGARVTKGLLKGLFDGSGVVVRESPARRVSGAVGATTGRGRRGLARVLSPYGGPGCGWPHGRGKAAVFQRGFARAHARAVRARGDSDCCTVPPPRSHQYLARVQLRGCRGPIVHRASRAIDC